MKIKGGKLWVMSSENSWLFPQFIKHTVNPPTGPNTDPSAGALPPSFPVQLRCLGWLVPVGLDLVTCGCVCATLTAQRRFHAIVAHKPWEFVQTEKTQIILSLQKLPEPDKVLRSNRRAALTGNRVCLVTYKVSAPFCQYLLYKRLLNIYRVMGKPGFLGLLRHKFSS